MDVVKPPKRRCGTCGFWDPLSEPGERKSSGQCFRHPPVFCGEFDPDGLPRFEWPITGVNATGASGARRTRGTGRGGPSE